MFLSFLKVMAGEGRERRTKHRQDTGGSSSQAPAARSKLLAKRRRPSSLREEFSPEYSPPRGDAPESPDEVECLTMSSPEIHTNRDIVNYSKEDPMNLVKLRNQPCYKSTRKEAPMRDFGHSFIKIGIKLCYIRRLIRWSNISGFTLSI
jgi:hypothetical protein